MAIRLICTSSLRLTTFEGDEVPHYAILSHTWIDDEEIDFQEMQELVDDNSHPARARPGFRKIRNTCRKAGTHGFAYACVDTCCIDKKNPAEVSEAINSMFKWYQQASMCYVYLEDSNGNLEGCRWLTRGWCLQELIAPRKMKFYDRYWQSLGSKTELSSLLSWLTSIQTSVLLHDEPLDGIPVARKMSWAAKRQTKKVEDIAYCLLGIFDINMPLLYGEGTKAFLRLQDEIIKRTDDLSIFAPLSEALTESGDAIRPCDLFASSPRAFSNFGGVVKSARQIENGWISSLPTPERHSTRDIFIHSIRPVPIRDSHPFAMTNMGLHFPARHLSIDTKHALFKLSLHPWSRDGRNDKHLSVVLQKADPVRFVPVRTTKSLKCQFKDWRAEDIYVITKLTPSITSMIKKSRFLCYTMAEHNIMNQKNYKFEPLEGEGIELWDYSREAFFIEGPLCRTTVKLDIRNLRYESDPRFRQDTKLGREPYRYVYLRCHAVSHSSVWFFSTADLEGERNEWFPTGSKDELRLRSVIISAKLFEEEYGYRVKVKVDIASDLFGLSSNFPKRISYLARGSK